jgi:hypothetical protein
MAVNRTEEKYEVTDTFGDDFDVDARPETTVTSSAVGSGWGDAEKLVAPSGDYPVEFKHSETIQIVKFLDPNGPFATYKMHFLSQKTSGKRSYVCLGANCPLCTVLNHRPESKQAFTIANLSADPIQRQQLIATPRFFKSLVAVNSSPQGPLTKENVYWALSRTGVKQTTAYQVTPIKARDLAEDWGIDEAAAEAIIATMQPYERSVIHENSYADLLEIAQELS